MLMTAKFKTIFPLILAIAAVGATSEPSALFIISPETTAILGPVRPDGSVDYVAALNDRFSKGVTPDNNGFVLWLRVMGAKGIPELDRQQMPAMCGEELHDTDPGWTAYPREAPIERGEFRLWKAQNDPAFADYLKSQEDVLALATQAAARPRWWEPFVSNNGAMIGVLLPELNPMRGVSMTLCDRALLRAQQGDFEGFLSDVMTVKRLSRRASGPFVVCDLVAIGIDVVADRTIAAAAGAGIFSRDQCAELAKALDGLESLHPISETVDVGERWSPLDWTQSIATGNLRGMLDMGDGDKWQKMFKAVDRDSVDWNAVLKQINGDYDEMIGIMKMPSLKDEQSAWRTYNQKSAKIKANSRSRASLAREPGETNEAYTQRMTDAILSVLLPSISRVADTSRSGAMEDEMARAVVAAAEYRTDKGKWPDRLEDLTPDYLPAAPKEAFSTGETRLVRYQRTSRGICLHARGLQGQDIAVGAQ